MKACEICHFTMDVSPTTSQVAIDAYNNHHASEVPLGEPVIHSTDG